MDEHIRTEQSLHPPAIGMRQTDIRLSTFGSSRGSAASSLGLPDLAWLDAGSVTTQPDFMTWRPSATSRLEVKFGEGSGQNAAPFSITRTHFETLCGDYQFCPAFLRRVIGRATLFEHHFGGGGNAPNGFSEPTHLEIAVAIYENDAFTCLLRYDIGNLNPSSVKCMLFVKSLGYIKSPQLGLHIMRTWLDKHRELLDRNPLLIINVALAFMQERAHEYVRGRQDLLDMEARLGVTHNLRGLRQSGYADVSYDFESLNADLAGLSKHVADNELSAATVREHARALHRVVRMCEAYEKRGGSAADMGSLSPTTEQQEEIQSTITRAELYLKHMKMMQDVLNSLTAVLYNRISKNDTRSMKTIAVVTLFILPSTLVSSIFSTGIFNFHANDSATDPKVVSSYGWVYLVSCLVLTLITLAAWVCWYIWGNAWLDKFRRSRRK